ncbi:hypothetical protein K431DRAFT_98298 [Polychaeton citri CBS 116435]|uniref:Uncharacterized protein n=1 Tax=Polychaeton citri CBS 116435 TaxID=1314669 RepID=A0A9P4QI18_9PEZI|nr:hypothetical protein K431DRAFT_98298 [Polychaeton citri CBS 116435]
MHLTRPRWTFQRQCVFVTRSGIKQSLSSGSIMSVRKLVAAMEKKMEGGLDDHGDRRSSVSKSITSSRTSVPAPSPSQDAANEQLGSVMDSTAHHLATPPPPLPPPIPQRSSARVSPVPQALRINKATGNSTSVKETVRASEADVEGPDAASALQTAACTQPTSPLLHLPPCIQHRIYQLVLTYRWPVPIRRLRQVAYYSPTVTDARDSPSVQMYVYQPKGFFEPALLRTCKQVRQGAGQFYYECNGFTAELEGIEDIAMLVEWLGSARDNHVSLTHRLTLSFHPKNAMQIESLRRAFGELNGQSITGSADTLGESLIRAGITVEQLEIRMPDLDAAVHDGSLLGFDRRADTVAVREMWMREVCWHVARAMARRSGESEGKLFECLTGWI